MIERKETDGIVTLRMTHGRANAMDLELLDALMDHFESLDGARAVIITGTGSIFSAGVDLFRLTEGGEEYVRSFFPRLSDFVRRYFTLPLPVIASVNGHAIAGGGVMTMAADYRVMAEGHGRIGVPELVVGVPFPAAVLEVVRFATRRDRVQALIYTGKTLTPAEALEHGLVDEIIPAAALEDHVVSVARKLASVPGDLFRLTKQAMRAPTLDLIAGAAAYDAKALALWCAPQTHARIREYLAKTVRR